MCEIINELYKVNKIRCGYINFKWLMIPMVFEILIPIISICAFHDRHSSNINPRMKHMSEFGLVCNIVLQSLFLEFNELVERLCWKMYKLVTKKPRSLNYYVN